MSSYCNKYDRIYLAIPPIIVGKENGILVQQTIFSRKGCWLIFYDLLRLNICEAVYEVCENSALLPVLYNISTSKWTLCKSSWRLLKPIWTPSKSKQSSFRLKYASSKSQNKRLYSEIYYFLHGSFISDIITIKFTQILAIKIEENRQKTRKKKSAGMCKTINIFCSTNGRGNCAR